MRVISSDHLNSAPYLELPLRTIGVTSVFVRVRTRRSNYGENGLFLVRRNRSYPDFFLDTTRTRNVVTRRYN